MTLFSLISYGIKHIIDSDDIPRPAAAPPRNIPVGCLAVWLRSGAARREAAWLSARTRAAPRRSKLAESKGDDGMAAAPLQSPIRIALGVPSAAPEKSIELPEKRSLVDRRHGIILHQAHEAVETRVVFGVACLNLFLGDCTHAHAHHLSAVGAPPEGRSLLGVCLDLFLLHLDGSAGVRPGPVGVALRERRDPAVFGHRLFAARPLPQRHRPLAVQERLEMLAHVLVPLRF